jgi:hypothetical protein
VRTSRIVATLGPAFLLACATARPARDVSFAERVEGPGLLFEVQYTRADVRELPRIESGLLAVGPRLSRWGSFREGVFVRVFPDHDSLERAVDRRGYPWLRAWSYGETVLLQSPRSWSAPEPLDEELNELLAHELTHALMYQLLQPADEPGWDYSVEEPPLWFREGMASVTAGQGHRRMSCEELSKWLAAHPGSDLLHPSSELYRTEKEAVYGAAHRAFDALVQRFGDQAVRDVLRGVRTGARFADSFKAATGRTLADFEQQTIRAGFAATAAAASGAGGP